MFSNGLDQFDKWSTGFQFSSQQLNSPRWFRPFIKDMLIKRSNWRLNLRSNSPVVTVLLEQSFSGVRMSHRHKRNPYNVPIPPTTDSNYITCFISEKQLFCDPVKPKAASHWNSLWMQPFFINFTRVYQAPRQAISLIDLSVKMEPNLY